jgi:hypothetical protein
MSVLDELPDRWSGMQREWEMVVEMVAEGINSIVIPDPPTFTRGLDHLTRFDLANAAITFDVEIGATISPDGTQDYRGIYISAYLEAVSSGIADPKMVVTVDTTETNYYGMGGVNEPKLKNGTILTATALYIEGLIVPYIEDGDMAGVLYGSNVTTATRAPIGVAYNGNWGWLPGSITSFDTLRFYRDSGGSYNDTSCVDIWGIV